MHKIENTDDYRLQNTDYDKVLKIQKKIQKLENTEYLKLQKIQNAE